ncbi:MAG TPA: UDP-N-acetylmuramoyl-tripeptide--D-alanyl-D-alanine ligase [Caldilineaceae bacterium]|nr:UDP-N-acetylmuramoyl-tripeptide--D-alanyl-D-alanine ligase [Caldilineaceae bacterium]
MPPILATQITQHTLWQALAGELPPLALPPAPIAHAGLDSRDMGPGDLFIALVGQNTDGHRYVGDALKRGAGAVICEERGQEQARAAGAVIIDCRQNRPEPPSLAWAAAAPNALAGRSLVYLVDDTVAALQQVGGFQRVHRSHPQLSVIGITGSVGKTSTKELAASVVSQRYKTLHNKGNLNSEQGLPLTLLELRPDHERAVLEMGMYALGEIATMCVLARPRIGVITNVGPVHLSRLGSMEAIAQAKSELVRALPAAEDGGVAILNWDDERVQAMASLTQARIFRYGLTPEADLWADEIVGAGMEGIRFRFHYRRPEAGRGERVESLHVRVPLLGRHSVHTALRAAAVGLVEGLSWEEIVAGIQNIPGQLRLVVAPGLNGSTIIDDTYNASPASTIAALNLLNDLEPGPGGRRIAVLGDMLELGHYTDEGHKIVGRRAADVVHTLVTVGELGRAIGEEARDAGIDDQRLFITADFEEAVSLLRRELRQGDLVLVKGSRAVGMDAIVLALSRDADGQDSLLQGTLRQH